MKIPHIFYEDNHILIALKPSGIPTQDLDDMRDIESLESILKKNIKIRDKKPGNIFLHAIFRLDMPVSGITLFAKSSKALARLQEMQRSHTYSKIYKALVIPSKNRLQPGILIDYLYKEEFYTRVSTIEEKNSKKAIMHIISVEPFLLDGHELLEVTIELETGRYHQIRAQLAARGYPIIGDRRYGGKELQIDGQCSFSEQAIALHHTKLSFHHPIQSHNSPITITSEAPWHHHFF